MRNRNSDMDAQGSPAGVGRRDLLRRTDVGALALGTLTAGAGVALTPASTQAQAGNGAATDGAAGYQGATIHSELGGPGTGINGSVTFAGVSAADAAAEFTASTGTTGGIPYLYIAYTGA